MRSLLAEDVLLLYPDHNLPFHIYTDASDIQLGSVIMQHDHPIAYYSRKLSQAQCHYTTIEKEILSIVQTLHEFRSMLLGSELHIHTDHRNLTFPYLTSQRVLCWRIYIEEFTPTFHFIKGTDNTIADALSRLPIRPSISSESPLLEGMSDATCSTPVASFSIIMDDFAMLECFLNHPDPNDTFKSPGS